MATSFLAFVCFSIIGTSNSLANESWANAYMGPQAGVEQYNANQYQYGPGQRGPSQIGPNQRGLSQPMVTGSSGASLPPLGTGESHDYRIAPYAGHYGHAQQVPSFRWGWFGAEHFYPQVRWHEGYNGELVRWSNQRRY